MPPIGLVLELDPHRGSAVFPLQHLDVHAEHFRRIHPTANEITGYQAVVIFAEHAVKAGNLAGRAAKQHLLALLQELGYAIEKVARIALEVFGASQRGEHFGIAGDDMRNGVILGVHGARDIPFHGEHPARKRGEHAAGRAVQADGIVRIPDGQRLGRRGPFERNGILFQKRANALAKSAIGAGGCVDLRIPESFLVPRHGDALLGAYVQACTTARTTHLVNDRNHLRLSEPPAPRPKMPHSFGGVMSR